MRWCRIGGMDLAPHLSVSHGKGGRACRLEERPSDASPRFVARLGARSSGSRRSCGQSCAIMRSACGRVSLGWRSSSLRRRRGPAAGGRSCCEKAATSWAASRRWASASGESAPRRRDAMRSSCSGGSRRRSSLAAALHRGGGRRSPGRCVDRRRRRPALWQRRERLRCRGLRPPSVRCRRHQASCRIEWTPSDALPGMTRPSRWASPSCWRATSRGSRRRDPAAGPRSPRSRGTRRAGRRPA